MENSTKIFDGLLVLQFQAGNKKALSQLVNRYHLKLCKHAFWYTHDMDASQDIVQDCWKVIIKKLTGLREPNRFGSWAYRIVTRKAIDHTNRVAYEREKLKVIQNFIPTEEESQARDSNLYRLREAVHTLPRNQQIVLRLFYTGDFSIDEIASILGISPGTVKSRLYHAREKLKTILKNQ